MKAVQLFLRKQGVFYQVFFVPSLQEETNDLIHEPVLRVIPFRVSQADKKLQTSCPDKKPRRILFSVRYENKEYI